jgi:hypothetical protein
MLNTSSSRSGKDLTGMMCDVHIACMGTKTISLKDEAYRRLKAARRYPDESFSEVVLRATWPEDTVTGQDLLAAISARAAHLHPDELDRADDLKRVGQPPPEDKWADR